LILITLEKTDQIEQSLILFRGLPGTGKSFIIDRIAEIFPDFLIINRDVIRNKIFPNPTYSKNEKEQLESSILFIVEENLKASRTIIIDGMTFASLKSISTFLQLAIRNKVKLKIIECECSERLALERINDDIRKKKHPAKDRNRGLYYDVKFRYEKIRIPHITIDTEKMLGGNIQAIIAYLNE
jgi:predicted kinase